jgi:ferrous iron transport protein A
MKHRLTYCPPGSNVTVNAINGGNGAVENITSLGINIGDTLTLSNISNGKGPVLVNKNGTEISVGRELAAKLIVDSDKKFVVTLAQTKVGDLVEVTKMNSSGDIRFRLLDMGLVKGVLIKVVRFAPLGDPIEVEVNGFNLTLRLEEANGIEIIVKEFGSNGNGKKKRWWNWSS